MKRFTPVALALFAVAGPLFGGEAPPEDDGAQALASRVTAVTVYADRARVTRSAEAKLAGESTRVAFRKLPGWVDEGSVRVAVSPADAAELLDVQVKKTFLTRPSDEEVRKAEAAVREISDQLAALDDERKVLEEQARQIEAIRVFSLDKLPKDAAVREIKVASYGEVVDFVGESLRKNAQSRRATDAKRRDLQPELNARQARLNELNARAQLEQRDVILVLKGKPGATVAVNLDYLVPGATWEPVHELRAGLDAKKVTLTSLAVVTQTTGEDWDGAALTLSTQRPGETLRLPELAGLFLGRGPSLPQAVAVYEDTFEVARKRFAGQRAEWNKANNPVEKQQVFLGNAVQIDEGQVRNRDVFALVQQRGTTAHFQCLSAPAVRTDGRPVRVATAKAELDAEHRLMAAPELSLNAAHVVDLCNTGTQPLLPGKVALFLEGAFLGTTELGFVSAGEAFSLFLGVEDRLKLSRTLDRKRSSLERSGKRTRVAAAFVVSAENVGDRPLSLQLMDRVPVSQSEEIRVNNLRILPEVRPDGQGLVRWEITLAPKEKREFRLEYAIEYPNEVLQRAEQAPAPQSIMKEKIEQQIWRLEESLKK